MCSVFTAVPRAMQAKHDEPLKIKPTKYLNMRHEADARAESNWFYWWTLATDIPFFLGGRKCLPFSNKALVFAESHISGGGTWDFD